MPLTCSIPISNRPNYIRRGILHCKRSCLYSPTKRRRGNYQGRPASAVQANTGMTTATVATTEPILSLNERHSGQSGVVRTSTCLAFSSVKDLSETQAPGAHGHCGRDQRESVFISPAGDWRSIQARNCEAVHSKTTRPRINKTNRRVETSMRTA